MSRADLTKGGISIKSLIENDFQFQLSLQEASGDRAQSP
jgi:hypothetical protein